MLKKDTLGNASARSLAEALKCGECLHFASSCHPHKPCPCSKSGVRAFAIAPKCFTPDITSIIQNAESFAVLAAILHGYTPKQLRVFLALLRGAKHCPKKGYKFGTRLYMTTGSDYLTSYRCGYVVGYTSSGELILAGSADCKSAGRTFFAYLPVETSGLLTPKQWKVKRKELIEAGRISTVKGTPRNVNADKYLSYEVPSIDTAQDYFEKLGGGKGKRKSRRTMDVTEFMVS